MGSLLFGQREARLASLERLPRSLWLGSLINSQGSLEPRLHAVSELRDALVAGNGPDSASSCWPDKSLSKRLQTIFLTLDLPRLCFDFAELSDQVLRSLLWHLDLIVDYVDRGDSEDAAVARAVDAFAGDWQERRGLIDELVTVFGASRDLLKNMDWDLLRGSLASEGWQEILRIRRLIEALPELSVLIRQLGRMQPSKDPDGSDLIERQLDQESSMFRSHERLTQVPEMPGATRGVHRSGRIARMLPSETMLLTHRRMRLVWHARYAERSLLTYEEDERMHEWVQESISVSQPRLRRSPGPRMEAGPMLICVDTSGSMQGGAEIVAKAVVLEAVRTAHDQKRACRVFAFGGVDEVIELELALDAPGIEQLAGFLGQGFRAGTDICGPLERVLARLSKERWQLADLLIASDGEFGATPQLASATANAKAELGLRVQGVLIGDRETIGMLELADNIFWVRDWRRYGGADADCPVHSKSLTATYFPGALRGARRVAPVHGDEASRAIFLSSQTGPA